MDMIDGQHDSIKIPLQAEVCFWGFEFEGKETIKTKLSEFHPIEKKIITVDRANSINIWNFDKNSNNINRTRLFHKNFSQLYGEILHDQEQTHSISQSTKKVSEHIPSKSSSKQDGALSFMKIQGKSQRKHKTKFNTPRHDLCPTPKQIQNLVHANPHGEILKVSFVVTYSDNNISAKEATNNIVILCEAGVVIYNVMTNEGQIVNNKELGAFISLDNKTMTKAPTTKVKCYPISYEVLRCNLNGSKLTLYAIGCSDGYIRIYRSGAYSRLHNSYLGAHWRLVHILNGEPLGIAAQPIDKHSLTSTKSIMLLKHVPMINNTENLHANAYRVSNALDTAVLSEPNFNLDSSLQAEYEVESTVDCSNGVANAYAAVTNAAVVTWNALISVNQSGLGCVFDLDNLEIGMSPDNTASNSSNTNPSNRHNTLIAVFQSEDYRVKSGSTVASVFEHITTASIKTGHSNMNSIHYDATSMLLHTVYDGDKLVRTWDMSVLFKAIRTNFTVSFNIPSDSGSRDADGVSNTQHRRRSAKSGFKGIFGRRSSRESAALGEHIGDACSDSGESSSSRYTNNHTSTLSSGIDIAPRLTSLVVHVVVIPCVCVKRSVNGEGGLGFNPVVDGRTGYATLEGGPSQSQSVSALSGKDYSKSVALMPLEYARYDNGTCFVGCKLKSGVVQVLVQHAPVAVTVQSHEQGLDSTEKTLNKDNDPTVDDSASVTSASTNATGAGSGASSKNYRGKTDSKLRNAQLKLSNSRLLHTAHCLNLSSLLGHYVENTIAINSTEKCVDPASTHSTSSLLPNGEEGISHGTVQKLLFETNEGNIKIYEISTNTVGAHHGVIAPCILLSTNIGVIVVALQQPCSPHLGCNFASHKLWKRNLTLMCDQNYGLGSGPTGHRRRSTVGDGIGLGSTLGDNTIEEERDDISQDSHSTVATISNVNNATTNNHKKTSQSNKLYGEGGSNALLSSPLPPHGMLCLQVVQCGFDSSNSAVSTNSIVRVVEQASILSSSGGLTLTRMAASSFSGNKSTSSGKGSVHASMHLLGSLSNPVYTMPCCKPVFLPSPSGRLVAIWWADTFYYIVVSTHHLLRSYANDTGTSSIDALKVIDKGECIALAWTDCGGVNITVANLKSVEVAVDKTIRSSAEEEIDEGNESKVDGAEGSQAEAGADHTNSAGKSDQERMSAVEGVDYLVTNSPIKKFDKGVGNNSGGGLFSGWYNKGADQTILLPSYTTVRTYTSDMEMDMMDASDADSESGSDSEVGHDKKTSIMKACKVVVKCEACTDVEGLPDVYMHLHSGPLVCVTSPLVSAGGNAQKSMSQVEIDAAGAGTTDGASHPRKTPLSHSNYYDSWKKERNDTSLYSQFYCLRRIEKTHIHTTTTVTTTTITKIVNKNVDVKEPVEDTDSQQGSDNESEHDFEGALSGDSQHNSTSSTTVTTETNSTTSRSSSIQLIPVGVVLPQVAHVEWDASTGLVAIVINDTVSIMELLVVENTVGGESKSDEPPVVVTEKPEYNETTGIDIAIRTTSTVSVTTTTRDTAPNLHYELLPICNTIVCGANSPFHGSNLNAFSTSNNFYRSLINAPNTSINHVYWSYGGNLMVTSNLGPNTGTHVEFVNTLYPYHRQQRALDYKKELCYSNKNDIPHSMYGVRKFSLLTSDSWNADNKACDINTVHLNESNISNRTITLKTEDSPASIKAEGNFSMIRCNQLASLILSNSKDVHIVGQLDGLDGVIWFHCNQKLFFIDLFEHVFSPAVITQIEILRSGDWEWNENEGDGKSPIKSEMTTKTANVAISKSPCHSPSRRLESVELCSDQEENDTEQDMICPYDPRAIVLLVSMLLGSADDGVDSGNDANQFPHQELLTHIMQWYVCLSFDGNDRVNSNIRSNGNISAPSCPLPMSFAEAQDLIMEMLLDGELGGELLALIIHLLSQQNESNEDVAPCENNSSANHNVSTNSNKNMTLSRTFTEYSVHSSNSHNSLNNGFGFGLKEKHFERMKCQYVEKYTTLKTSSFRVLDTDILHVTDSVRDVKDNSDLSLVLCSGNTNIDMHQILNKYPTFGNTLEACINSIYKIPIKIM